MTIAYSEQLADRTRGILTGTQGLDERKMFGGPAKPHSREMDFTGRPLKGMVYVESERIRADGPLREWVERGLDFVFSLPPK